jgi:hypothetical protein
MPTTTPIQKKVASELEKLVEEYTKALIEKPDARTLLDANEHYNELVKKGLVKKRGYTLRGIEDNHLFRHNLAGK